MRPKLREQNIKIRKFRVSDASKVSRLVRGTLKTVNAREYPKKTIQMFVKYFSAQNIKKDSKTDSIYLAFAGSKLVGCGKVSRENWIGMLFLKPRYIGKGIGALLLSQLEKAAKKHKTKAIHANSAPGALRFYIKHGFKKVKKIKKDTGGIAYVVKKKL